MIAILDNLFSLLTIPVGFVLDNFIIFAITPVGFVSLFLLLILAEYLIVKSIISDPNRINIKKIVSYMKSYQPKYSSLNSFQRRAFDAISKKENICIKEISENIGITLGGTRKLVSELINKGCVVRKVNINDRRAFCYTVS